MEKRLTPALRGKIRLGITAAYPERVLNVLAGRGIAFWEVDWRGEGELSLSIHRADYHTAKAALDALGAEVTVEQRAGVGYFLRRFRRRYALLTGLGILMLLVIANSLFIWDFEVNGAETVSKTEVLRALEEVGLRRGSFAPGLRPQELCNQILPQFPELAWLTVNVRGCRAYIELRERVEKPPIVSEAVPSNVIAKKDALVTEVRALDGEAKVMKGMSVFEGQLLISGAVETKNVQNPSVPTRFLAGHGQVWGRTWYDLSVKIPLIYEEKRYSGERDYALAVQFGTKRVKFGAKGSSNPGAMCDKIIKTIPLSLPGGFALPITLAVETYSSYEMHAAARSRAEAQAQGEALLGEYLRSIIDGEVRSERYASAVEDDWLLVTLSAECHEQIGQIVPIPMEEG